MADDVQIGEEEHGVELLVVDSSNTVVIFGVLLIYIGFIIYNIHFYALDSAYNRTHRFICKLPPPNHSRSSYKLDIELKGITQRTSAMTMAYAVQRDKAGQEWNVTGDSLIVLNSNSEAAQYGTVIHKLPDVSFWFDQDAKISTLTNEIPVELNNKTNRAKVSIYITAPLRGANSIIVYFKYRHIGLIEGEPIAALGVFLVVLFLVCTFTIEYSLTGFNLCTKVANVLGIIAVFSNIPTQFLESIGSSGIHAVGLLQSLSIGILEFLFILEFEFIRRHGKEPRPAVVMALGSFFMLFSVTTVSVDLTPVFSVNYDYRRLICFYSIGFILTVVWSILAFIWLTPKFRQRYYAFLVLSIAYSGLLAGYAVLEEIKQRVPYYRSCLEFWKPVTSDLALIMLIINQKRSPASYDTLKDVSHPHDNQLFLVDDLSNIEENSDEEDQS